MEKDGAKNIFSNALEFVKQNSSIIYSLFLLVMIPAAFFVNNYWMNSNYQGVIDQITQRNAVMVENVANNLVQNKIGDIAAIQASLDRVKKENDQVVVLSILKPVSDGVFEVVASTDQSLIGQKEEGNVQSLLAWSTTEPIAYLDQDGGRFWKVTKQLFDDSNQKAGLIEGSFSLVDSDALVNKAISDSYWVLFITILVVVLLIANQARLLDYALTVAKLKEVDHMKDMFMSMASHELRTPLTAIKWYLDMLKEKKDLMRDEEAGHYVDNLSELAKRLNNLVEDILEVSRIEGNHLPMEIEVFDAAPVIAQSVDEMRSQAAGKGLALNFKPLGAPAMIKADQSRLKQILINLIGNAAKYTEKGSISVEVFAKKDELAITVADTGIGISAQDQEKLFKKFSRIVNDKTRDIMGTGLGLWITFEIIKRMQGKINVESIEGIGSHFTVRFPLVKK